jgi:hypothetical protein
MLQTRQAFSAEAAAVVPLMHQERMEVMME